MINILNRIILIGRWAKSPDLRCSPNGTAVVNCTLAVGRKKKDDGADFIPVVVLGKQAENTANYTDKGSLIAVEGRLQVRTYDAKDGTKRWVTEVVAENVRFLDKKGAGESGTSYGNEVDFTDDSIPF